MPEEKDFDYVVGKLPRRDKDGNDTTGDRIGKGGHHRDDGTYSAISSYLTTVSKWGEAEILARAEMLSDELIAIWKYPKKD